MRLDTFGIAGTGCMAFGARRAVCETRRRARTAPYRFAASRAAANP
jgi:hypothetical protein